MQFGVTPMTTWSTWFCRLLGGEILPGHSCEDQQRRSRATPWPRWTRPNRRGRLRLPVPPAIETTARSFSLSPRVIEESREGVLAFRRYRACGLSIPHILQRYVEWKHSSVPTERKSSLRTPEPYTILLISAASFHRRGYCSFLTMEKYSPFFFFLFFLNSTKQCNSLKGVFFLLVFFREHANQAATNRIDIICIPSFRQCPQSEETRNYT